jgi:hypothetical protein
MRVKRALSIAQASARRNRQLAMVARSDLRVPLLAALEWAIPTSQGTACFPRAGDI